MQNPKDIFSLINGIFNFYHNGRRTYWNSLHSSENYKKQRKYKILEKSYIWWLKTSTEETGSI